MLCVPKKLKTDGGEGERERGKREREERESVCVCGVMIVILKRISDLGEGELVVIALHTSTPSSG